MEKSKLLRKETRVAALTAEAFLKKRNQTIQALPSRETTDGFISKPDEPEPSSFRELQDIFYPLEIEWGSEEHRLGITSALSSPLYSAELKNYFVGANSSEAFVLRAADRYLTEEAILSYVTSPATGVIHLSYFAALMNSSHLSERIVIMAISKMGDYEDRHALDLISDRMITSKVMNAWLKRAGKGLVTLKDRRELAAERIRQAYPDYKGFPDGWVLEIFCDR